MNVRIVKDSRLPRWPAWALAAIGAWAVLAAAAHWLGRAAGAPATLCPLRRLTGLPCPTCGSTRAAFSLLSGHVGAAWAYNPLVFCVGVLLAVSLLARAIFARRIELKLTPGERRLAWATGAALLLANWVYVIARTG